MFSDSLRLQHSEIRDIAAAMQQRIQKSGAFDANAANLHRKSIVELSGRLTFHLTTEDRVVYPKLQQCADVRAQAVAQMFADEMGGLSGSFKEYLAHWPNGNAIFAHQERFIAESQALIGALSARMAREERELYPLLDALEAKA